MTNANPGFNPSHFNPGSQKEADFLASFIARQETFQFFLTQLKNTADHQTAKPQLIIAPRGYGKTSLLRRIKIALRDQDDLNTRFIPLSFREEQHNVISLDVFWRNCLLSLCEAREDENAPQAELDALDQMWERHAPRSNIKREEQDGSPGWNAFSEHCRKVGRRPVLLIDNLDTLLAGLVDTHQWGLRTILQKPDGPLLIAAASRYPAEMSDNKAAFYDFFRITTLKALADDEVMACLRELATIRGDKGLSVLHMLDTDPGRINALNTMAGGNPRTLGVLYTVLESHMGDDVLGQLGAMLDTFTGWYQARTEELPLQSRAVFDALALNWDPMTAADIGAVTGLDTPSVSSQLSRLEKSGYAETVSQSKTKKARNAYQVSERFFNIWYLMRNGSRHTRQKIRFLTLFLRACFSSGELENMAEEKLLRESNRPESILALAACIGKNGLRTRLLATVVGKLPEYEGTDELMALVDGIYKATKPRGRKSSGNALDNFETFRNTFFVMFKEGKFAEAEILCRDTIAKRPKVNFLEFVWFYLGFLHHSCFRAFDQAEKAYRSAIALNKESSPTWLFLGVLLEDGCGRPEEALFAYQQILMLGKINTPLLGTITYLCALQLQKIDEARTYAKQAEPDLSPCAQHLMQAALAWGDTGINAAINGWQAFNQAVADDDDRLWTEHIDKVQQILAFAVARGDGPDVRAWMEAASYPSKYAPLYHAFCTLLDGEDYLLLINPEVRGMAEKIYAGLLKKQALFARIKPVGR
jgi:tetratricopeptide (TPR) repeat protein